VIFNLIRGDTNFFFDRSNLVKQLDLFPLGSFGKLLLKGHHAFRRAV
jgi:hypothetical protein